MSWSDLAWGGGFTIASFSEPPASIDGFVLMFMPNLYLFFSVDVLTIAVFCVCPLERLLRCWLSGLKVVLLPM